MVVVCHVCREVVHTSNGCIVTHGIKHHGQFCVCAGSLMSVCTTVDCCGV